MNVSWQDQRELPVSTPALHFSSVITVLSVATFNAAVDHASPGNWGASCWNNMGEMLAGEIEELTVAQQERDVSPDK